MRKLNKFCSGPTNLKLFHLLLKLSNQTLFILQFRLKMTQLKVFSLGGGAREKRRASKQRRKANICCQSVICFSLVVSS